MKEIASFMEFFLPKAALVLLALGSLVAIWYFVVYVASFLTSRRERVFRGSGRMKFAVVIPTYNDDVGPSVKSSVEAGADHVIVLDTSDREEIKKVNEEVCRRYGAEWVWMERGGYKAWNLNRALETLDLDRYDYVLFLDADASVPKDFFRVVEGYLEKNPVEVLQTEWRPYPGIHGDLLSYFSWVYAAVFQKLVTPVLNFFDAGLVFGSGFLVRSDVLKGLRFDERFIAEDFKFALDVMERGGKVRYYTGTGVYVSQPISLTEMGKQLERWGYGSAQIIMYTLKRGKVNPAVAVLFLTALSAHVITPAYLVLSLLSMLFLPSPGIPLAVATAAYVIGILPLATIGFLQMRRDGVNYPLSRKVFSYLLNMAFWFVFTWKGVAKASLGLPLRWDPTEKVVSHG